MKKVMAGITIFIAMITLIGCGNSDTDTDYVKKENLYTRVAIVGNLNHDRDIVSCIDTTGEIWEFDWIDDWDVGDLCILVIDGKGTKTLKDDEIILYTYSYASLN